MCGRYANYKAPPVFAKLFDARLGDIALAPRYNIAPSSPVLACRTDAEGGREMVLLRWGLVPSWAKDPKTGYRMINARAETVAQKPAYRTAFKRRRCLIAADGFYEWRPAGARKQPYFMRLKDGEPFAFAGLWEHWQHEDQSIESCTIIVTDANALVATVHERMPVILPPQHYAQWLDPAEHEPARLLPLLAPYPAAGMEAYPVSTLVNTPKNDTPDLIERLTQA